MIIEYKDLSVLPNSDMIRNLEARKIDTGFKNNEFDESYDILKNNDKDRFTREYSDIEHCLEELEDESMWMFGVNNFFIFFNESPFQVFGCILPHHFELLLNYMLRPETQFPILYTLCSLIQIIQDSPDFIQVLLDFNFYKHLNEIMSKTNELMIINYCLFNVIHSFNINTDIQSAIINSGILETAKSYKISDATTNKLISRLFETVFSIQDLSIIEYLHQPYSDFLLKLAFYGETSKSRSYALRGLLNLFRNFPNYTSILENNIGVDKLSINLSDKNGKIRIYSSKILYQCIKAPNFPLSIFTQYNIIESMLKTFEWDDQDLLLSCIENLKELIYKFDENITQLIVHEINETNFFDCLECIYLDVKKELILLLADLFSIINPDQIGLIMKDRFVFFLTDFISTGLYIDVTSLLIITILNKSPDDQFKSKLFEIFNNNDLLPTLEDLILRDDIKSQEIDHLSELINILKECEANGQEPELSEQVTEM